MRKLSISPLCGHTPTKNKNSLSCGSCLLLAGSVADVVGNRSINLIGCLLVSCFVLGCGLARTGIELIMFRAMQGVAVSFCLPTSVAIVSNAVPNGRKRNIGFSCLGFVQPIGFSAGLVLGGVILQTVGWRFGYYITAGLCFALFLVSLKVLPIEDKKNDWASIARLRTDIDWVGAFASCACLSLFSYILA
jgi:MFS family permease